MSVELLDKYREANPGMTAGEEDEVSLEPYAGQLGMLDLILKFKTNGSVQLGLFQIMAVKFQYQWISGSTVQIVFHRNGKWHASEPSLWGKNQMQTMVLVNELAVM